jgi:hypothetical protein
LSQTDPLIGRRVRDLQIAERIGRGGMGAVYRAEHLLLREPRAVKVIRAELFHAVPEAISRVEREARIAVRLRHPNLVLVHDFFVEDGDHFLVMEYVVGRSLGELLRERGPLPIEEICRIGAQCCAGLAHAHELGIVHRDLSPENVMLTGSSDGPTAKIIDFGVARAALSADTTRGGAHATLTRVGDFIGKPRYASPEQAGALRHGEELDGRSDLYALGLVLFELATGLPPFQSESAVGYLALHLSERPPAPSALRPDLEIPRALERIILRCLEKRRDDRFADARELGAALEAFGRDHADRPRRARTRTSLAAGAAALAAATLAVTAGALWRASLPAAPVPVALAPPATKPAPLSVPAPAPTPERVEAKAAPPEPAKPEAAKPEPAKPEPAKPAPARPAPTAPSFANEAEMQTAFEAARAFESEHDAAASIANWKRFRARAPSRELDEQAKRRITELTLGGMQSFP